MAFRESNRQIHLRRMDIYKARQTDDNSWKEKCWLHAEFGESRKSLQETRIRILEET